MSISTFIINEKQNREDEVWYKQKAVIELLTYAGEKPKKIRECLTVVYGEDVFDTIIFVSRHVRPKKKVKISGPRPSRSSEIAKKC